MTGFRLALDESQDHRSEAAGAASDGRAGSDPVADGLVDPGKDAADRQSARQARLVAWQRPADQRTRDQLRDQRVAAARAAMAAEDERLRLQLAVAVKELVR